MNYIQNIQNYMHIFVPANVKYFCTLMVQILNLFTQHYGHICGPQLLNSLIEINKRIKKLWTKKYVLSLFACSTNLKTSLTLLILKQTQTSDSGVNKDKSHVNKLGLPESSICKN